MYPSVDMDHFRVRGVGFLLVVKLHEYQDIFPAQKITLNSIFAVPFEGQYLF